MSLKEKTRKFLPENLKNKRRVLAVYLILRLLVILVMIAQVMNGNYENVYICFLTQCSLHQAPHLLPHLRQHLSPLLHPLQVLSPALPLLRQSPDI